MKELFYGVSSYDCNNERLFNYIQDNQGTDKTLLKYRFRWESSGKEEFIGIPLVTHSDGSIDLMKFMLAQKLWDENEHSQIVKRIAPKVFELEGVNCGRLAYFGEHDE